MVDMGFQQMAQRKWLIPDGEDRPLINGTEVKIVGRMTNAE